jgi:uncharacterized membrane protein
VNSFFDQLYGNGELKIVYPANYTASSVSPKPNGGDHSPQTLDWIGTQFLPNGNPIVVLSALSSTPAPDQSGSWDWQLYALAGAGIAVAAVSISGVYVIRRRKKQNSKPTSMARAEPVVESEEEKILKLLRASGGSAYQSALTEQLRFSKAKTSQLLTALEKKGVVTRYKKGRDKIVTLTEQGKGEKP